MPILLSDELRLLYALTLLVIPYLAGYHFSRRCGFDRLTSATSAFVLFYTVQYLSVCLPGLAGHLNPITIAATAILFSAILLFIASRLHRAVASPQKSISRFDRLTFAASLAFVGAYLAALIDHQAFFPITATDALTYHAPAAVQWLQTGRLGLYPTWFFNPANTYSPLAGSAFIAYLIAPLGNDVLARFVQVIPLIFLFVAVSDLLRRLNVRLAIAAMIAAGALLARPFVSQSILAKDDLFAAAFLVATIHAMTMPPDRKRLLAPLTAGLALGLLLATKYTAFYALPITVLMIDAPLRVGWRGRDYALLLFIALAVAAPWYARNWILTGNPIYPAEVRLFGLQIFPGMFHVQRSHLLDSPAGVWKIFTAGYFSAPLGVNIILIGACVIALALNVRRVLKDPLRRALLLGPILVIAFFSLTAPYGEFRFTYPALILLFASIALVLERLPEFIQFPVAAAVALLSATTAFPSVMAYPFTLTAMVVSAVVTVFVYAWNHPRMPRVLRPASVSVASLAVIIGIYIHWHAYIAAYREQGTYAAWSVPTLYGAQSDLWRFVREELPKGSTMAYTNTYLTYPLTGFTHDHRVIYIPTRKNLKTFLDLPRIPEPLTGEEIPGHITNTLRADPDQAQWLTRLRASGAQYLVIRTDPEEKANATELQFAFEDPNHFERVFPSSSTLSSPGYVYRIHWPD